MASARHNPSNPSPASVNRSIAPPPPVSLDSTTVSVAVVVGEFPAAFVQNSEYVKVPRVTGVTVF